MVFNFIKRNYTFDTFKFKIEYKIYCRKIEILIKNTFYITQF